MRRANPPLVEMSNPVRGSPNGAAEAENAAIEEEAQKLYETIANTSGRDAAEGVTGADILNCFMLCSCNLKRAGQTAVKHILQEVRATDSFKANFARVIDHLVGDYASSLEVWEERHARYLVHREDFVKLYNFVLSASDDPNCSVRANCARLLDFFQRDPSVVTRQLEEHADYFNTLFNLFDLGQTDKVGSSDARISVHEFVEGMEMLNFQDLSANTKTFSRGTQASRRALFAPPSENADDFSPTEFVVSYYYSKGLAQEGLNRAGFLELCTLLSLCGDHGNHYLIDDLDAALNAAKDTSAGWAAVYRKKIMFACQFRDRLKLVVENSVSGQISPFSWSVVMYTLFHGIFQPVIGLYTLVQETQRDLELYWRTEELSGFPEDEESADESSMMMMAAFKPQVSRVASIILKNLGRYLIRAIGYGLLVAPGTLFTNYCFRSDNVCCVIPLEAYLPGTLVLFGLLAYASIQGYASKALQSSSFRMHRLRLRLRTAEVICRDRTRGVDCSLTATQLIERQIVNSTPQDFSTDWMLEELEELLQTKYIRAVADPMARGLITTNVVLSVLLAMLPGITREARDGTGDKDTEMCTRFFGREGFDPELSPVERFIAFDAMILTAVGTIVLGFVLIRLYVELAIVLRAVNRFTRVSNTRNYRSQILQEESNVIELKPDMQLVGRAPLTMSLMFPQNIVAWSKIRLYLQLKYQSECDAVQIMLGHVIVFFVGCIGLLILQLSMGSDGESSTWAVTVSANLVLYIAVFIATPLAVALRIGVAVNQTYQDHAVMLATAQYEAQESLSALADTMNTITVARASNRNVPNLPVPTAAAMKSSEENLPVEALMQLQQRRLKEARELLVDLQHILQAKDTPLAVLGIPLTPALMRTIFAAIFTSVGSIVAARLPGLFSGVSTGNA